MLVDRALKSRDITSTVRKGNDDQITKERALCKTVSTLGDIPSRAVFDTKTEKNIWKRFETRYSGKFMLSTLETLTTLLDKKIRKPLGTGDRISILELKLPMWLLCVLSWKGPFQSPYP